MPNLREWMIAIETFFRANVWHLFWVVAVAVGGRLLLYLASLHILRRADDGDDARISGREKRARTLADLLTTTGKVVLALIVVIMLLQIVGVDPMPIIAGASVLGFGIGFGAQTLIRDLFAGVFIFSENQFAIGDRVKIGAVEGVVYKMSMRTTVICDPDGNLVFIPNGTITSVVNFSLGEKRKSRFGGHDEGAHDRKE